MTSDGEKSDAEFVVLGRGSVHRTKKMKINRGVEQRNRRQPPERDHNEHCEATLVKLSIEGTDARSTIFGDAAHLIGLVFFDR